MKRIVYTNGERVVIYQTFLQRTEDLCIFTLGRNKTLVFSPLHVFFYFKLSILNLTGTSLHRDKFSLQTNC